MTTATTNSGYQEQPDSVANNQRQRQKRKWIWIIASAIVHVFLIAAAFPLMCWYPNSLFAQIIGPLGLIASASAAAFFTACVNAMQRVCWQPNILERTKKCVLQASQLETLFRMLIGVSVGGGSFLFVLLTRN